MENKNTDAIIEKARAGAEAVVAEQMSVLRKFAEIDCGTGDENGNAQVVELVTEQLRKIKGIEIEYVCSKGYGKHIIARLKSEKRKGKIILNAHMDTVFHGGDTKEHPYHEDGDKAYGLGIADCKGGILVAIHAVRIMQEADLLPEKEIVFLFNCDEEMGTPVGHAVFDREIPDAEMAFVFEPSREENGILTARKGNCSIKIEVFGKSAHSGLNYLEGRSAVVELAHKILRLYESNKKEKGIFFNVVEPYGGEAGEGTVPDYASAWAGVRVSSQDDIEMVKQIISEIEAEAYIDGTRTKIYIDNIMPPMERNEANLGLYEKVCHAGELLGMKLPEQSSGGCGDASYFSYKGVPVVDGLGPYMYKIHSFEESMRISSMKEKTMLFATVLGTIDE